MTNVRHRIIERLESNGVDFRLEGDEIVVRHGDDTEAWAFADAEGVDVSDTDADRIYAVMTNWTEARA